MKGLRRQSIFADANTGLSAKITTFWSKQQAGDGQTEEDKGAKYTEMLKSFKKRVEVYHPREELRTKDTMFRFYQIPKDKIKRKETPGYVGVDPFLAFYKKSKNYVKEA
jgi:hypothetical protein